MKVKWTTALITAILIYILLEWLRGYLVSFLPETLKGLSMIIILFIAAKLMGNILELIFTRTTTWMRVDDFIEEIFIFVFLGFFCWLFVLGAQRFIGGSVQLVYVPPVAYYLINWLYREGKSGEHELV